MDMFECSEPRYVKSFKAFSSWSHIWKSRTILWRIRGSQKLHNYDKLCRDWVKMFTAAVNIIEGVTCTPSNQESVSASSPLDLTISMSWALPNLWARSYRFTDRVKKYLTGRFDLSDQTGSKSDPQQKSNDVRKAWAKQNNRLFTFQQQDSTEMVLDLLLEEEDDRQHLKQKVTKELRLQHPLLYDALRFNLCECVRENKLSQFNVPMLTQILHHFEVPFKSREQEVMTYDSWTIPKGSWHTLQDIHLL